MSEAATAISSWNVAYEDGKYAGDPPINFVETIVDNLGDAGKDRFGLYVGCGNGRNFIPLIDAGLKLHGIDFSNVAIEQLKSNRPEAKVTTVDFNNLRQANVWDYLVSIQVFQHGGKKEVDDLFQQARQILKPGGKMFLRVNSASTEIQHAHKVLEQQGKAGSKTIQYTEGPKEGLKIHFFTARELGAIAAKTSFNTLSTPREVTQQRQPPQQGTWSQLETIWQRKV